MKKEYVYRGVTFGDLLLVAFIVMKMTGVIDWSWWWVLAPLWIPVFIVSIVVILAVGREWYETD